MQQSGTCKENTVIGTHKVQTDGRYSGWSPQTQTGVGKVKPPIRRVQEFRLEPRGFGVGYTGQLLG